MRRKRRAARQARPAQTTCAGTWPTAASRSSWCFKQRKKERPKLVILCDVSSLGRERRRASCCSSSTACRTASPRSAAFVFVAELGEVTPALPRPRDQRRHRQGPRRRRRDQRLHALELRAGLPHVLARLPVGDRQPHHRGRARRRAEQLQRPARLVPARHPLQGEERDLAQSGEPRAPGASATA